MEKPIQEMEDRELHVLLVEDSEPDRELTIRLLNAAGFKCAYRCVANGQEMRSALRARLPDLILSDFCLAGFGGVRPLGLAAVGGAAVSFLFFFRALREAGSLRVL